MRFRLIWVGKTKNAHLRALADDYLQRLGRFVRCEVTELRESASAEERICLEEESKRIKGALASEPFTVLLDVEGERQWSSPELAAEFERWQEQGVKEVAFVVGGHLGVAAEVKRRADVRWSLSRLTLTHEMARVVVAEQLYRAYTIMRGLPYQK
ncbi:MAG TPA: 23S rRNA (pseudouridine(1915)-N(3))-methyltransferase RlmH [Pyrinomonadaceae bacterium]|jgi:23S rRNA (pseudouridine1915-N3)-methyltransferase